MRAGLGRNLVTGVVAGVAGTALIRGMMAGTRRYAPETLPPMQEDPGEFVMKKAERWLPSKTQRKLPAAAKTAAKLAMSYGYGSTFPLIYTALRPRTKNLFWEGLALGAAAWATGYLGWLPGAKLLPPIWKQKRKQVLPNLLSHALFGWVSVWLIRWVRGRLRV